jgi:hypothetical protein
MLHLPSLAHLLKMQPRHRQGHHKDRYRRLRHDAETKLSGPHLASCRLTDRPHRPILMGHHPLLTGWHHPLRLMGCRHPLHLRNEEPLRCICV